MNFFEIHDQYYRPVKNFIASMVKDQWAAEHLVQDTFIRVQEKLPTLCDQDKLKTRTARRYPRTPAESWPII